MVSGFVLVAAVALLGVFVRFVKAAEHLCGVVQDLVGGGGLQWDRGGGRGVVQSGGERVSRCCA